MGTGVGSETPRPASVPPRPPYPPPPAHRPGSTHTAHTPRLPGPRTGHGDAVRDTAQGGSPEPSPSAPGYGVARAARGSAAAGVCLVLGVGLLGGAVAGRWLGGETAAASTARDTGARAYADARDIWHGTPVDTLFPRTVNGRGAGPGGADRTWTRIGVAPDSGCEGAFDPGLARVLAPVGCVRLLRATYTDATSTDVTTVGVLVARATPSAMADLYNRWTRDRLGDRAGLMPRPVPFPGTAAAAFGPAQRASWTIRVSATLPLVVFAVSGFADGRPVGDPQPAAGATAEGATSAPAQAGLGNDAEGLAAAVDHAFTSAADAAARQSTGDPE